MFQQPGFVRSPYHANTMYFVEGFVNEQLINSTPSILRKNSVKLTPFSPQSQAKIFSDSKNDTTNLNTSTDLAPGASFNSTMGTPPPVSHQHNISNVPSTMEHLKIHTLEYHEDSVLCIAICNFTLDSKPTKYVFSGSQESSIGVWNCDTFQLIDTLLGHSRAILNLEVIQPKAKQFLLHFHAYFALHSVFVFVY